MSLKNCFGCSKPKRGDHPCSRLFHITTPKPKRQTGQTHLTSPSKSTHQNKIHHKHQTQSPYPPLLPPSPKTLTLHPPLHPPPPSPPPSQNNKMPLHINQQTPIPPLRHHIHPYPPIPPPHLSLPIPITPPWQPCRQPSPRVRVRALGGGEDA